MSGVQPVLYGYLASGFVYFYFYKKIKMWMSVYLVDENSTGGERPLWHIFMMSAGASIIAELISLVLYYPYDLIKTRMQSMEEKYRYKNVTDASIKIMNESSQMKVMNFYKGSFLYGIAYVSFIGIEFSLYESLLVYIERNSK